MGTIPWERPRTTSLRRGARRETRTPGVRLANDRRTVCRRLGPTGVACWEVQLRSSRIVSEPHVVIRVQRNGNYLITGPVTLLDTAGNPYQLDGGEFSLCRCGQSKDKPFCDDTHETVGFKDACKTAIKVQEEREG